MCYSNSEDWDNAVGDRLIEQNILPNRWRGTYLYVSAYLQSVG